MARTDPAPQRDAGRRPGAVIVLSSHVARGAVGNRAAVFALERLGHPVWAVPTVTLPWHPGHGPATRIVPDAQQFAAFLGDLAAAPWLGEVAAVLSGYLGAAHQAAPIAALVAAARARNSDLVYLCDPVIGDAGGLYVPQATAAAIRDTLLPVADIATPNRFELGWLVGETPRTLDATVAAARRLGPPQVLVTSAPCAEPATTGSLLVGPSGATLAAHAAVADPPNGPGDLTAALFLARLIGGAAPEAALAAATASVADILAHAARAGADELALQAEAERLVRPRATVRLSAVGALHA